MMKLLSLNNIKTYLIVAGIVGAVILWKDYSYQKAENKRQSNNISQIRKQDSLRFASQYYSKRELEEYINYNRSDLKAFLDEEGVRLRRIERIITQSLKYRDTASRSTDLKPILDAIRENKSFKVPVVDSTACLIVSGYVAFENDTLSLDITDRQFTNKTDVVSYWERNQWKFLGLKTRLFGRKTATVVIKDECGATKTFVIDKRK